VLHFRDAEDTGLENRIRITVCDFISRLALLPPPPRSRA
jgi:hypothetical protein